MFRRFVILSLLLLVPGLTRRADAAAAPPNIVIILADDMGYGDVQTLNSTSIIATPNLNRLAADGMTFLDAHTPSAVCTPTRYGLITGRYCWRSRLKSGVLNGYDAPLIETERSTLASFLKSHGYRTGVVGKWHLGLGFVKGGDGQIDFTQKLTHGPNSLGFDYSHVIPASLDFPPYVYIENHQVTGVPQVTQSAQKFPRFLRKGELGSDFDMEGCLDHLAEQASGFVRESAKGNQPFFLYFPLTAPHKPAWPHQRFVGKTKLGPYGDFVAQVDATVGVVLEVLDQAGVRDNTLLIYTSDNGSYMYRLDDLTKPDHIVDESIQAFRADRHRANGPWRGTKADIWEAGHRVPFFVRWPGHVKPGSQSDSTICLTDVYATVAELLDKSIPEKAAADSFSFATALAGKPAAAPRPFVVNHSVAGMFAVRDGRWKLVLGDGSGGRQQPRGKPFERPYQLFDLDTDPGETTNLIEKHADVAERLEVAAETMRQNEWYGRK
ncbi:sulfatase-like hydrolase/transferase [bacterium]|nr:sulfatase-like hydrolase/transferase [bacterium]